MSESLAGGLPDCNYYSTGSAGFLGVVVALVPYSFFHVRTKKEKRILMPATKARKKNKQTVKLPAISTSNSIPGEKSLELQVAIGVANVDAGSDVASSGRSNASSRRTNASKINKLTSKVKCAVCTHAIVGGNDQALLCKCACGACGIWIHRYCAGVLLAHFEHSSSTSKPYICGTSKLLILWNFMPLKFLVKTLQKEVSQQYTFCFGRSKEEM